MKDEKINQFIKKVEKLKKEHKLDLSLDEDLSIAIMNLVSLEEHFFFTGAKTGKGEYYDLLLKVREMRKELLKKIVKDTEGEVWCISKHLLATSMRLIEVGTKCYNQGKKEEAEDFFSKAYNLYSLFWGINLKLIDIGDVKKIDDNQLNVHDNPGKEKSLNKKEENDGLMGRLNNLVQDLIDCCKE